MLSIKEIEMFCLYTGGAGNVGGGIEYGGFGPCDVSVGGSSRVKTIFCSNVYKTNLLFGTHPD